MKASAYVNRVMQNIRLLPRQLKRRVRDEIESSITHRLDHGDTFSDIEADMGRPSEIALEIMSGFGFKFNSRLSLLRYVYLLFAMVPTAYIFVTIIHVLTTPTPSGFATAADLFFNLFQNYFLGVIQLLVNYLLFLGLCCFGYIGFSRQLFLKKKHILFMIFLSLVIGVILLPSVYGIDTMVMIYNVFNIFISNRNVFFLNIMQPQNFVAIFTIIALLRFFMKSSSH